MTALQKIRDIVVTDPDITLTLAAIATESELFDAVVTLATANGLGITRAELEAAANFNRRAWLERWIAL